MILPSLKKIIEANALGLATVGKNGKPHNIAVACVKVEGNVIIISNAHIKESIKNIEKNDEVALVVWNKEWEKSCVGFELIGKAREGKLSLEEISNGTFTVTNLGMYGIRSFSPIINPPQAAILAVGEIYTEPAVVDGKIKPESFMNLSLSCDHRIIDGAIGAKFLRRIAELIENPAELVN